MEVVTLLGRTYSVASSDWIPAFAGMTDKKRKNVRSQAASPPGLRFSEPKWRNILMNTPQVGISLDPQARIVFANKHFLQLTG